MNSYSLMEWVFKVFSLRLLKKIHIFENTEQEERKNFSILWSFSKCSKIQFYVLFIVPTHIHTTPEDRSGRSDGADC